MSDAGKTIVALSDTHGLHARMAHAVPDGDILVHAGDFCGRGLIEEVLVFADWLAKFPHPGKLVTAGNHDRPVEEFETECRAIFEERGIRLLLGESAVIDGIRFFVSPCTPTFLNWHFMRDRGPDIRAEWEKIPEDTDVLITHGPPYGHGDLCPPWKGAPPVHAGCFDLLARLREVRPRFHVFGHIHGGHGVTASGEVPETVFLNASVCTESYSPVNPPHRIRFT